MKQMRTTFLACALLLAAAAVAQTPKNGFELSGALVPAAQIESGGPAKDGIPAIDRPKFVRAGDARFLRGDDRVLGVARNGVAKAYPVRILNWHEIVNDSFGVSGLLYNSDALVYDRQTQSLWSQILAQAVSGPLKGAKLTSVALTHTIWVDWKQRHPDTLGGKTLTVRFDPEHRTGAVFDAQGEEIPTVTAFWFAWYAFHRDTEVFQAK